MRASIPPLTSHNSRCHGHHQDTAGLRLPTAQVAANQVINLTEALRDIGLRLMTVQVLAVALVALPRFAALDPYASIGSY